MIKIAHRGNINGKSLLENNPQYLYDAINMGFDAEADLWFIESKWYLGHDIPEHEISMNFINEINDNLWIHCKNLNALYELDSKKYKFFWHQEDDYTLTSNGYIWTYPGKNITSKSILVDLDLSIFANNNIYGICSDYVKLIQD